MERVRDAAAQRRRLRITGGQSKRFHPASADLAQGPCLDMRPYAGIVSYEPSELVITARAGTPLAEVEALLARHGQCLAFEPPRFAMDAAAGAAAGAVNGTANGTGGTAGSTVGGMVSSGLSGPARASVGALRDFVLGAEILNGRGELLRFGGQVMKNVAGYDVSRLVAGSWGRLAAITEVSLKVLPLAPAEATLRFDCDQARALALLHAWGGQPLPLNASCWLPEDGQGRLYVRLRGAQAAVQAACRSMGGALLPTESAAQDWQACRDQRLPWFTQRAPGLALWRLSLPQTAPALPPSLGVPLIEWHGGLRWLQAPPEHTEAITAQARQAGGNATIFIAASHGQTPGNGIFDLQDPVLQGLQQRLSQAFDPQGVFSAGQGA